VLSETHLLELRERVFPGKELANAYSANVVDICPVGALTDREFRFAVRVWYLDAAKSVCPGCSRGCNIEVHSNVRRPHHNGGRRVARLKPRYNAARVCCQRLGASARDVIRIAADFDDQECAAVGKMADSLDSLLAPEPDQAVVEAFERLGPMRQQPRHLVCGDEHVVEPQHREREVLGARREHQRRA